MCCTSTYQPQPEIERLPSTSQLFVEALHTTRITVPDEAALIGVLRAAPRSTPSCAGRIGVRNPLTSDAFTGCTQVRGGVVALGQVGIGNEARDTYASETQ